MTDEELVRFNRKLHQEFGNVPADSRPLFRLVDTSKEIEVRQGTFNEFHGPIFLRRTCGTQKTLKYPYLKGQYYAIERWYPFTTSELPESNNGYYEPIYIFMDGKEDPLPPKLTVASLVCKMSLYMSGGPLLNGVKHTHKASDFTEQDAKTFANEVSYFETQFEHEAPNLIDGVVVPRNYERNS